MSQIFPSLPDLPPENIVIGPDFDMMKRQPLRESFVGYNQVSFNNLFLFILFNGAYFLLESF